MLQIFEAASRTSAILHFRKFGPILLSQAQSHIGVLRKLNVTVDDLVQLQPKTADDKVLTVSVCCYDTRLKSINRWMMFDYAKLKGQHQTL